MFNFYNMVNIELNKCTNGFIRLLIFSYVIDPKTKMIAKEDQVGTSEAKKKEWYKMEKSELRRADSNYYLSKAWHAGILPIY